MSVPANLKYTEQHEWVTGSGTALKVGITDYAQTELGDVVFVDLPEVGTTFKRGESFATVESVKAVSDVYAPVDGKVVARNDALIDTPELINQSAFEQGWFITIEPSNPSQLNELLDGKGYDNFIGQLSK